MVEKQVLDALKSRYLLDILEGEDIRASSAMVAYAKYLNDQGIRYDYFPLYLNIFETNNTYAIDALLKGHTPERFVEVIIVPNIYIIKNIFRLFSKFIRGEMHDAVLMIFCGILRIIYQEPEAGIRYYTPTIGDINNLSKFLNEDEDQEYPRNRIILDILLCISDLEEHIHNNKIVLDIARQASRIRSDYFDNQRKLVQSITEVILRKKENPQLGVAPDEHYLE